MIDQEVQQALDEKQDEILTGMPVPQDGKIGDIRTNVTHKGKFYQTMKIGINTHFFSAPFSRVPSIHTMDDYLLKSGGKMLNGSLLDAYDVTVRNGLTLPGLSPGEAVLVLDGTGKVVTDENLTWDGSELFITGAQDIMHTATEADDRALEIDCNAAGFGDVKAIDIAYITGAIAAGQDEGVILVNIDESLATGGDVFALAVLPTEGSAGIYGLKAGALVGPIHQDSGTFANMDSALVNAVDRRAEFISSASDIAIFVADNDTVTIGDAATFEEIEFLLATTASVSIKPTFEFSTGVGAWTAFTPVDGTNGMRNTGVIAWDVADIPTWAVGAGAEYLIRITRTRNNLTTTPVEDKVQIAATTTYEWTKSGDVFIRNIGRDADNLLDFATDNEITFRVGAADRGTWTTTGLGIGTNAPDAIFHIKANTPGTVGSHPAGQLIIQDPDDTVFGNAVITGYESDGAGNPDQQLWYLGSSSGSNSDIIFLNRRSSKLQLGTSGAAKMTILGDGNVGVGVADPDELLELYKVGTQLKLSGGAADYATFAVAADGALTITTVDADAAEGDITLAPDGNVILGGGSATADTDNTVLVLNAANEIRTDEIDSRVWGSSLVDYTGTPANNQIATFTDVDTIQGESGLIFDGSQLKVTTSSAPNIFISSTAASGADRRSYVDFRDGNDDGWRIWSLPDGAGQPLSIRAIENGALTEVFSLTDAGILYVLDSLHTDGELLVDGTGNSRIMGSLGINIAAPLAKLHIDQAVNDAAIPVLTLDQADISDGFINFIGSDRGVITGATDSLESVRVEIGGVVRRIALYVDA